MNVNLNTELIQILLWSHPWNTFLWSQILNILRTWQILCRLSIYNVTSPILFWLYKVNLLIKTYKLHIICNCFYYIIFISSELLESITCTSKVTNCCEWIFQFWKITKIWLIIVLQGWVEKNVGVEQNRPYMSSKTGWGGVNKWIKEISSKVSTRLQFLWTN